MKVHVFHYKWPGIKEGLIHTEHEVRSSWDVSRLSPPKGAFIFCGSWLCKPDPGTVQSLDPSKVPNEIRAMALLLT